MRSISRMNWALLALIAVGQRSEAAGILEQLPADATGFVAIHRLSATSEKIERVLAIFQKLTPGPLPAPLAIAQAATGIGPGLDTQGNALLAVLPSDEAPFPPHFLLLLPTNDYAALADSLGGDATGEICRVTIADEEVLLAKRGDFAALMNVEHRDQLQNVLASAPAVPAELAPLADWLATTDVSMGLTRSGVERLTALGRRRAADQRQQAAANDDGSVESPILQDFQRTMQTLDFALEFLDAEVTAGAVGLTIDEATNVKLAKRVILAKAGLLASLADAKPLEKSPLARFAPRQFVIAGGGPLPKGFAEASGSLARRFMEQLPPGRGYEGLTADDWQKLEQSYREKMQGLLSTSFILYSGEKEEGLLSNYFAISQVSDAQAYLQHFRKSIELDNELMEQAENDLSIPYELSETEVAGKPTIAAVADVAGAADDPNVPGVASMMKTAFGPDGKMRLYAVAADAQTAVVGSAAPERVAQAVEFALSDSASLADDTDVIVATKLLDPSAPWTTLVSPSGAVAWAARGAQSWAATFGGNLNIPPFPATAPMGVSFTLKQGEFRGELVLPVQLLQGIADYAITVQGL
jgi:hypothetical protein